MALLEYRTPDGKPPRLMLRVVAGLAGAGLMPLAVVLFLIAIGCCGQASTPDAGMNSESVLGLFLAGLVTLGMSLAAGWISLQLIHLALRNVGESLEIGMQKSDSAETEYMGRDQ